MKAYGFTGNTEVWCSDGFYKTFEQLLNSKEYFLTDSFDKDSNQFNVSRSQLIEVGNTDELIEVTFGGTKKTVTVRCTPNTQFLTCYENSGKNYYKNDTFFYVEVQRLKEGTRLVAEDVNIWVKKVRIVKLDNSV